MTEERFTLEIEDDMYYTIFDNQSTDEEDQLYGLDDEQICNLLNEFSDENRQIKDSNHTLAQNLIKSLDARIRLERENKQLKKVIEENEKLIQSTYDELTKLRCIKKNLIRVKNQLDFIMEAIQYD